MTEQLHQQENPASDLYASLSDVPLLRTVLCKHKGTTWSEIFEITKFAYSKNAKCVYLRSITGMPGNQVINYFWRDAEALNDQYEVFDVMGDNVSGNQVISQSTTEQ